MFSLQFNEQYDSLILPLATMLLSMVLGLIIISALNIRQRSGTEKELKDSEQKYRELIVQLPQTVFELDALGNVVFINPFGCHYWGTLMMICRQDLTSKMLWSKKKER